MILRASTEPISGYTGYLMQPHPSNYNTSVLFVADYNKRELNIILTQPGSYSTAYRVASMANYQEVNIFVTCLDASFMSDVYRLAKDLRRLNKKSIHIIFPERLPMQVDSVIKMNHFKVSTFESKNDRNIRIEYHLSKESDYNAALQNNASVNGCVYDILVRLGQKMIFVPGVLSMWNLAKWCNCKGIEIHVPYSTTLYGGLSYLDLEDKAGRDIDYAIFRDCYVNSFASTEEYSIVRNNGTVRLAENASKYLL